MLKIVLPLVAMIVGVAAGLFLGARRRGPQSDASSPSPLASGRALARTVWMRLGGWLAGAARWARPFAKHLSAALQVLVQSARRRLPRASRLAPQAGDNPAPAATCTIAREAAGSVRPSGETHSTNEWEGTVDPGVLNCRARIGREPKGDTWQTVLVLDICGTIEAPDDGHEVVLKTTLSDVTDNKGQTPLPVPARPKQGPINRAVSFTYQTEIGKLCQRHTVLEDWMTVAQLSPEWFVLPRQGRRQLRFNVAILSRSTGQQLAAGSCIGAFENLEIGYLDVDDNIQRAKTLAVGLAFSVGAANNALREPETNVIYGWVRTNFGSGDASEGARLELEQALRKTAGFFLKGGRLNLEEICKEIVEIAPMVGRLDIMDLCLRVAGAKGQVTATDIGLLKNLAQWLRIDRTRLRAMVEKTLPVSMHQSEDAEMILGVTTEMSQDEVRHQLNREYAKWSSRVISSDPAIRKQADQMLNLIANARTQYIGVRPTA